jgi:hypothetical protein
MTKEEHFAQLRQRATTRKEMEQEAVRLLKEHSIILAGNAARPTYFMLHPSTTIRNGWQVTFYDEDGPYGHSESRTQDEAIKDAIYMTPLETMRPVSEAEFMALSQTPRFVAGSKRATLILLLNTLGYESQGEATVPAWQAITDSDVDEAIEIVRTALEAWRSAHAR